MATHLRVSASFHHTRSWVLGSTRGEASLQLVDLPLSTSYLGLFSHFKFQNLKFPNGAPRVYRLLQVPQYAEEPPYLIVLGKVGLGCIWDSLLGDNKERVMA